MSWLWLQDASITTNHQKENVNWSWLLEPGRKNKHLNLNSKHMAGKIFRKTEDVKGTVHVACYCLKCSLTRPMWGER